jgi:hypothetical protein
VVRGDGEADVGPFKTVDADGRGIVSVLLGLGSAGPG